MPYESAQSRATTPRRMRPSHLNSVPWSFRGGRVVFDAAVDGDDRRVRWRGRRPHYGLWWGHLEPWRRRVALEEGPEGRVLLGMELCEGGSLYDIIAEQQQRIPYAHQIRISRELCEAVAFLHQHKIVHRDIR